MSPSQHKGSRRKEVARMSPDQNKNAANGKEGGAKNVS